MSSVPLKLKQGDRRRAQGPLRWGVFGPRRAPLQAVSSSATKVLLRFEAGNWWKPRCALQKLGEFLLRNLDQAHLLHPCWGTDPSPGPRWLEKAPSRATLSPWERAGFPIRPPVSSERCGTRSALQERVSRCRDALHREAGRLRGWLHARAVIRANVRSPCCTGEGGLSSGLTFKNMVQGEVWRGIDSNMTLNRVPKVLRE